MTLGCPDATEKGEHTRNCPLLKLELAHASEVGTILQRAQNIRAILNAGIKVDQCELNAAELTALLVIQEEIAKFEREPKQNGRS